MKMTKPKCWWVLGIFFAVAAVTAGCHKHAGTTLAENGELGALRQEVAALREEVAQLRRGKGRAISVDQAGGEVSEDVIAGSDEVFKQLNLMREQLAASQREVTSNLVQIAVDRGSDAWRRGDFKEAMKLLRPLAEGGQPIAAHRLGVMYVLGQGVPKDSAKAIEFFSKAAEQGQGESQHSLGLRYLWGDGTDKNPETAAAWFTAAANQGIPDSASWLADMYWRGEGVAQDFVEGYKWLLLSKDKFSFYRQSGQTMDQYAAQLTPAQRTEAEQRARDFVPQRTGPEDF